MATNIVILNGRLAADVELKNAATGTAYCGFNLAVSRSTKDGGADFIHCKAFGKTAETICQYLAKGSPLIVNGHIQTGSYKGKDDKTVYTTDVIVDHFDFVGSKKDSEGETSPKAQPAAGDAFMDIPDDFADGIPFN